MIPALVALSFLATRVVCVPVLSPEHGTPIAFDFQKVPNDINDLQAVTTLSPISKRQVTVIEYIQNDPNDPNNITPISTYIQNAVVPTPIPTPTPTPQPATTTPTDTGDDGSNGGDTGSTDGSPLSDGVSLLTTINKWRTAYGRDLLTWSDDLATAAFNTGTLDGGDSSKEAHHPAPQAAEVISPGSDNDMGKDLQGHSPFEISYVNWLCEVQSDVVGDLCAFQQSIMWT
ncbi:MAG: hypothetical protein Q9195_009127 [Heterodermia aff. obscurata]